MSRSKTLTESNREAVAAALDMAAELYLRYAEECSQQATDAMPATRATFRRMAEQFQRQAADALELAADYRNADAATLDGLPDDTLDAQLERPRNEAASGPPQ